MSDVLIFALQINALPKVHRILQANWKSLTNNADNEPSYSCVECYGPFGSLAWCCTCCLCSLQCVTGRLNTFPLSWKHVFMKETAVTAALRGCTKAADLIGILRNVKKQANEQEWNWLMKETPDAGETLVFRTDNESVRMFLLEHQAPALARDQKGESLLTKSIRSRHLRVMRFLGSMHNDSWTSLLPELEQRKGRNSFWVALRYAPCVKTTAVFATLSTINIDDMDTCDKDGVSLIQYAYIIRSKWLERERESIHDNGVATWCRHGHSVRACRKGRRIFVETAIHYLVARCGASIRRLDDPLMRSFKGEYVQNLWESMQYLMPIPTVIVHMIMSYLAM